MSRPKSILPAVLLSCAVAVPAALADITLEEKMSVEGTGLMRMANMSGRTVTIIAGDRARTESDLQMESRMVRMLARGMGPTAEIVRLDQDRIYQLDLKKKTYKETSFEERRAEMQAAMEQMREGQQAQRQATSGVDESECEWSDPNVEVNKSGESAAIAGFQAERITIAATQSCTDKKTGQVCDFGLTLDQWLAPDFDGAEETLAYHRAYAEKLGFGATASRDFAERAESLFGGYTGIWSEVAGKMGDMDGYPVKSSFSLGIGGPQCQDARQQTSDNSATPRIGDAIGGALGGLIGRKREAAQPAAEAPPAQAGGVIPLMTVSTELLSVSRTPASPEAFEVPGDFKKEKN